MVARRSNEPEFDFEASDADLAKLAPLKVTISRACWAAGANA